MIKFLDSLTLARTKLRTHKVRTGITVGISGLLFGLILLVIIFSQGMLNSIEKYNKLGLNNRNILAVAPISDKYFTAYEHSEDQSFIIEVENMHKAVVAKKVAAAKKYSIDYDPKTENPSPIAVDPTTKKKTITPDGLNSQIVNDLAEQKTKELQVPFDINNFISKYKSASVVSNFNSIAPQKDSIAYMKNGKEGWSAGSSKQQESANVIYMGSNENRYFFTKMSQSLSDAFITSKSYDPSKGEIPVIVPYSMAVKSLKLKALDKKSSNEDKLNRLKEVHNKINEVAIPFCYRNEASVDLVQTAIVQRDEIKSNANNKEYVKPSIIYKLPDESTCGPVTIEKDTRTAEQKKQDANRVLYNKAIGAYLGEPLQQKIIARGVGVSAETSMDSDTSVSGMISGILSNQLGYESGLVVPEGLLSKVPAQYRPDAVFKSDLNTYSALSQRTFLVEFKDKGEMRAIIKELGGFESMYQKGIIMQSFGSNSLIIDEIKTYIATGIFWAVIVVGFIAIVILASIVGRTISEGRKESAVFRAIGAKRIDIANIYGIYAMLLSIRVAIFSTILAATIAVIVDITITKDATLGAKFAYSAPNSNIEFHFLGADWTALIIIGIILAVGLASAVIPIIMNARRNPIKDMREE